VLLPHDENPSIATMIFGAAIGTNFRYQNGFTNIVVVIKKLYIFKNKEAACNGLPLSKVCVSRY
jgi:hypothetical protein